MEPLLKAIKIYGEGQAGFARGITENLPEESTADPVTPQQIWNWLNRDLIVPAEYCPTIEKICNGAVRCEELNTDADWAVLRVPELATPSPEEKAGA